MDVDPPVLRVAAGQAVAAEQPVHQPSGDIGHVGPAEAVERDDAVDAVEELGPEETLGRRPVPPAGGLGVGAARAEAEPGVGVAGPDRARFYEVIGRPELVEQFAQPLYFGDTKKAVFEQLSTTFRTRSTVEWCALLTEHKLRHAPVRDHAAVVARRSGTVRARPSANPS